MDVGVPELIIILVIVILLFGVGRIGKIAGELGSGIRAFREGLQGDEPEKKPAAAGTTPVSVVESDKSKSETAQTPHDTDS